MVNFGGPRGLAYDADFVGSLGYFLVQPPQR